MPLYQIKQGKGGFMNEFKEFNYVGAGGKKHDYFLYPDDDTIITRIRTGHQEGMECWYPIGNLLSWIYVDLYQNPDFEVMREQNPQLVGIPELRRGQDTRGYTQTFDTLEELAWHNWADLHLNEGKNQKKENFPRIARAAEMDSFGDRSSCAVMIGIDWDEHFGRHVLPDDPDYHKPVFVAADPISHMDGLAEEERSKLMYDSNHAAGIASIDLDDLETLVPYLQDPKEQRKWLCHVVNEASRYNPVLKVEDIYDDLSIRFSGNVTSREPKNLKEYIDPSRYIGAYDSFEEMLLDNVGNIPITDIMANKKAAQDPVFRAKLEHKREQNRQHVKFIIAINPSRGKDDLER